MDLDKFNGKFRISIRRSTWGQGECGYELTLFSSHEEEEVIKARDHLIKLVEMYERSEREAGRRNLL